MRNKAGRNIRWLTVISTVLCILFVTAAFLLFYSAKWYVAVYGKMGFESILYTLFSGLGAVDSGLMRDFMQRVLPETIFCSILVCAFLFFRSRRKIVLTLFGKLKVRLFPVKHIVSVLLSLVICAGLLIRAADDVELTKYIKSTNELSVVFEDEYQDPSDTEITFPEEKRNLIYIFMESMEITYMSRTQNGALDYNTIPELYDLAKNNVNFSANQEVGGFCTIYGTNWTVGSMVAQTAGVPLKTPPGVDGNGYGQDGNFLPGLTTLTDVLHENGYYQTLMVGSDAKFGGRYQYFTRHNIDKVYDIYTAKEDGIIPEDYFVWWGMEDKYLFEYAKQELTEIAAREEPFAFTMLTVDTHHIGGYVCEYCENTYPEQYENVMACASRQVNAFVEWIKQQDFYENTTIVIVGDHLSMDNDYFQRNVASDYSRTVYNCFINAAAEADQNHGRVFCALDMFPTTLGAMGCTIEGDRLGLGTNLFSGTPTLLEEMGWTELNSALSKTSVYYTQNFFFE